MQYRATLVSHELIDQLNTALNTRIVIEQAKGVVAESRDLDMHRAFAALRRHARSHNLRLSDVAAAVVSGTLRPSSLTLAPPPGQRPTG